MGKSTSAGFRAICPNCERGPFSINKSGTIRKHACWTKVSIVDAAVASERKARAEHVRECASACRQISARRGSVNRVDALKVAFAIGVALIALLGSCA